ncbi:MAG: hypothetical protein HQK77_00430 [Desulfobacterales bacterium]|nr:hypothetical protein [Desulfobacterales bacterium]
MKKVQKIAVIMSLILAMCASAWAWNETDHVSVAPNGKGDLLIYPVYFTGGGWDTYLTVINTSPTLSAVAKVVIRSAHRSQEVRDFFIYLSPTDVWTGTLYMASDNKPHIMSTDDSCLNSSSTFASAVAPFDIYLENTCAGDTNTIGYVEIIEAACFDLGGPPVAKSRIKAAYDGLTSILAANSPRNILTGLEEVYNDITGQSFGLNATVLKNYDSRELMSVTVETLLGFNSRNSIAEVEAALSKNSVAVPYFSNQLFFGIYTFPTKMAGFPCNVQAWRGKYAGFPSPTVGIQTRDCSENTTSSPTVFVSPIGQATPLTLSQEVNFLVYGDLKVTFTEGWFVMGLPAGPTSDFTADGSRLDYSGAPIIASSIRLDSDASGAWLYNAHDLGSVSVDNVLEAQYQYFIQTDN